MSDYSVYTKEDFNDLNNYDLYGFYDDINISNDEAAERMEEALKRSKEVNCSDTYKLNSLPLFEKRDLIKRCTVKDSIELLSDDTFHKLIALDPLERPQAENVLRMQASKFKCKTEFNKKLKVIEKNVIANDIASIKPPDLPFITVKRLDIATGRPEYSVNTALLAEYVRTHCHYFFVNDMTGNKNTLKYWYTNGVFKLVNDNEIKGIIKEFVAQFDITLVNMRDIEEVFKNIMTDHRFLEYSDLYSDENIINFENGLLYLDTMELRPHDSSVPSTIQIPCKWDPNATHCPNFNSYLNTLTNGNIEVQQLLLQFMGVALSNVHGYRMKKSLFMVGKGNSGKSQLRLLCDMLLGAKNVSSESLAIYEKSNFGTMSLMGKRLVGSPDMPPMNAKAMDMCKIITGGDGIPVQVKNGGFYTIKFNGVMWNCGNELPKFGGDKGAHVNERFVIVRCDNVIPEEKRDKQLLEKLYAEREAIVVLAITALKKVISNHYRYDIPECCLLNNAEYQIANSSVLTFYEECCCERKTAVDNCTCAKMYEVFKAWCRDNSNYTPKKSEFRQEIADTLSGGDISRLIKKVEGVQYFVFTLTIEAKTIYASTYGVDTVQ